MKKVQSETSKFGSDSFLQDRFLACCKPVLAYSNTNPSPNWQRDEERMQTLGQLV
jgi:hypothetical protein